VLDGVPLAESVPLLSAGHRETAIPITTVVRSWNERRRFLSPPIEAIQIRDDSRWISIPVLGRASDLTYLWDLPKEDDVSAMTAVNKCPRDCELAYRWINSTVSQLPDALFGLSLHWCATAGSLEHHIE